MARMVEGRWAGRPLAGLALSSAALVLAVAAWSPGSDGDGEGPELAPPSGMPAIAQPVPPARARPATPAPGGGRAVLALPGITTPGTRTPPVLTSTPSTSAVDPGLTPSPRELMLDGPIEMPGAPSTARPAPGPVPGRANRPITLDPLPMDEPIATAVPDARANPSNRRTPANATRRDPVSPPTRRGRFFGLGPGPVVAPSGPKAMAPGRSLADDSLDDRAADSALKKRIEKQARELVGDRARLIEVRVADKSVAIQARGVRFYQKRAVRKSLESLPALSGLRSTIDLGD